MKDKIFKAIKCVLFMLPFVFVGGKTLYTILNDNSKDSYSDNLFLNTNLQSDNNFIVGNVYEIVFKETTGITLYSPQIYYSDISIDWSEYSSFNNNQVNGFRFYPDNSVYKYYITLYYDDTYVGLSRAVWGTELLNFTFIYSSSTTSNGQPMYELYNYLYVINTLDNAFEYSLSEFNNIGFGKIDFLEWFNDMFLNNNFNNVYSTFINSYLNYFLFVELVMFIPSVFHWVIHFFTEIGNNVISKSTDKKKGD